ncbi:MAG: Ig-like domain-containing protein, partial [Candidatus Hadarchaeales archaeon]
APTLTPVTAVISPEIFSVASGGSTTITVMLFDSNYRPLAGKLITWTATDGTISSTSSTTDSQGKATVVYTAPTVNIQTSVIIVAKFEGDNQYSPVQVASRGLVLIPDIAKAVKTIQTSLEDLKFAVENIGEKVEKVATAISEGKIALSVTVKVEAATGEVKFENEFKHQQVSAVVQKRGNNIEVQLTSENTEGRTAIINIDNYALPIINIEHVQVFVDGTQINMADNYDDVLNPADDGDRPEYLILVGGQGVQVLVSIPHFSTRTITIGTMPTVPVAGVPSFYLVVAAAIVLVVVILAVVWRYISLGKAKLR